VGNILRGFAVLMTGMESMSSAVSPLAGNEGFTGILTMFSHPLLGMAAGALLTAVIQSSSASVGILQALCATGAIGYSAAIPIILGQNIGTCVTALLSSVGASKNARRAAMIHLYFNVIGTLLFMVVFYSLNNALDFVFMKEPVNAAGIAVIHTLFNVGCVLVLFPFTDYLVKLAELTVPDKGADKDRKDREEVRELAVLDERFLEKPAFAMELCRNAASKMAEVSVRSILLALDLLTEYTEEKAEEVMHLEQLADAFEDHLGTYLLKLSDKNLSTKDSRSMSVILHCISDFERISDHAVNIRESVLAMEQNKMVFSPRAKAELQVLIRAVRDIAGETERIFRENDLELAAHIEPLEEVIDGLNMQIRQRHIRRLRKGKCTIELGIILEDLITGLERVADHCSNIAVCLIQVSADGFDTHEYLDEDIRQSESFRAEVLAMKQKYCLPGNIS
jgi:phosphate:Na+ symporter